MRPVPVVFLRLAFSPQLSASCQFLCSVGRDVVGQHTLPGLSGGVSTRGAGVLLDVEGAAAWVNFR